jgi:malonyl-CoA/methylmalonyl-CoA synthetase
MTESNDNLYALFESRFPADRSRTFIEVPGGRAWSYGDLEAESGRIANRLRALGVVPGDRVAVQVEKSPEALFLYLACLRAGAIYLPLNTAYKAGEIGYFLGDAEPRVFVCDPAQEAEARSIAKKAGVAQVETLGADGKGSLSDGAAGEAAQCETARAATDDIAAILYTSGTTGRSKGAMLSHGNLASNALVLHESWGFEPADVLLHALPIYHTHGLFVATNTVLLNGSAMIFLAKFDPRQVMDLLPRATVFMGVPTLFVRLLEQTDFGAETCRSMRLFVAGSAPLLPQTFDEFRARTGHAVLERYGMTEAGMITSNPLRGERIAGKVGPPLPSVEARVADPDGKVLGTGEVGILEIRGPNVFKGYWRMPEKTAEEFRPDGYFITGDMAVIDEAGYVAIVGRSKDLVISGGFNVYPKEVELAIDALPGVVESAVIGLPHKDIGEGVTAVVKAEAGAALDEAGIIAAIRDELAVFKVPKRVFFVDELPRNAMGKVQKNALRERYAGTYERDS